MRERPYYHKEFSKRITHKHERALLQDCQHELIDVKCRLCTRKAKIEGYCYQCFDDYGKAKAKTG